MQESVEEEKAFNLVICYFEPGDLPMAPNLGLRNLNKQVEMSEKPDTNSSKFQCKVYQSTDKMSWP